MKEASEQEKKDKKFGMIMSAIVHGTLLCIFLILVAWRAPDPPNKEYGMEVNIGFQDVGFGDTESEVDSPLPDTENETPPDAEADTQETQEEVVDESTEEVVEEVAPEVQQEVKEEVTEPVEEVKEVVEDPVEEVADPVTTQETESPVKAEEEKKEPTEKEKVEEEKPVEEKKDPVTPPAEEEKPVEPKPKPKPTVNKKAILGGKKTDTNATDPASSNQGKTVDERGNMGKPDGKKNTDGQVPGGADFGVSLNLDGWKWNRPPADKDDSQIDGIIKFQIQVDDRGDVIDVIKMPGTTISDNTIVNFYEKQVRKLIFIRTDNTKAAAAISKGEITFVIKTK